MQCLECHTQKKSQSCHFWQSTEEKNFARTIDRPLLKMSKVWTVITEKTSHSAPLLIVLNVDHYGCTGWWGELLPTSCQMWNLPFKNWVDGSPLRAKISRKTSSSSSSQLNEIRVKIQRSLCYISIASKILSLPSSRLDFSGRGERRMTNVLNASALRREITFFRICHKASNVRWQLEPMSFQARKLVGLWYLMSPKS